MSDITQLSDARLRDILQRSKASGTHHEDSDALDIATVVESVILARNAMRKASVTMRVAYLQTLLGTGT